MNAYEGTETVEKGARKAEAERERRGNNQAAAQIAFTFWNGPPVDGLHSGHEDRHAKR